MKDANGYHLTGKPSDKKYKTNPAGYLHFQFDNPTDDRVSIKLDDFSLNKTPKCPAWICSVLQVDIDPHKKGHIHFLATPFAATYPPDYYTFEFYARAGTGGWGLPIEDPELEIDRRGTLKFVLLLLVFVITAVGVGAWWFIRRRSRRKGSPER
jgi:hypothetical protein